MKFLGHSNPFQPLVVLNFPFRYFFFYYIILYFLIFYWYKFFMTQRISLNFFVFNLLALNRKYYLSWISSLSFLYLRLLFMMPLTVPKWLCIIWLSSSIPWLSPILWLPSIPWLSSILLLSFSILLWFFTVLLRFSYILRLSFHRYFLVIFYYFFILFF